MNQYMAAAVAHLAPLSGSTPTLSSWAVREVTAFVAVFVVLKWFLTVSIRRIWKKKRRLMEELPPGPKGWPVVGALPLLVGKMPHVALAKMAKKYGPVMYLKMGSFGVVVASTPDAARVFLKTLDVNFSNRPIDAGPTRLAYGDQDLVFARYGPRWRELRKLCNLGMLGSRALENWSDVRRSEMRRMVADIAEASRLGEPLTVVEMLVYAMANMIGQVILSRRVFESKDAKSNEFKEMVVELMTSAGLVNIGDYVPALAWMDLQGIEGGMKRLHRRFDDLLSRMVNEHTASSGERRGKPDLLDLLMAVGSDDEAALSAVNIKGVLLNLFTAGTDTSSSTIEWAMAEMLQNPAILNRAQSEMDKVIGRSRRLEESDIPNLPYLRAICKEAFRKHPSTPLNLPRVSTDACEVNGFHVPKGTRLMVNIWAIGRDPVVWPNPDRFDPDRFMIGPAAEMDPRGNDFELLPFGAGRRICAGARLGVVLVEYMLGTLIHSFDWVNARKEMDMEEVFGLALQKAVPVSAKVRPRLDPNLYNKP